jgi:hypothetical protein
MRPKNKTAGTMIPYILYVNAHPACTEAIKYAQRLGPQTVQLIDVRALMPPPPWLQGVPTLVSTQRQGPALMGSHVVAWLQSFLQSQSQQAYAAPTTASRRSLDQLFQSEFDKQSGPNSAAISGQTLNDQQSSIGHSYVGANQANATSAFDLMGDLTGKVTSQDVERYTQYREQYRAPQQRFIGVSDLPDQVKLTM